MLEWLALALSVVALLLAAVTLPTTFQMWWGRPRLQIEFKRERVRSGVGLICRIVNVPIRRRVLRWLGVRRDTARGVGVTAEIRQSGSGQFVGRSQLTLTVADIDSFRADVPVTPPAWAIIMIHKDGAPEAQFPQAYGSDIEVQSGEYDCTLAVTWGENKINARRTFLIGRDEDTTVWRSRTNG